MWANPPQTADLVTFTEEILNEKLIFCTVFSNPHAELPVFEKKH